MKHATEATMKSILSLAILFLAVPRTVRAEPQAGAEPQAETAIAGRWTVERINQWQQRQGWLVGCNYLPASRMSLPEEPCFRRSSRPMTTRSRPNRRPASCQ